MLNFSRESNLFEPVANFKRQRTYDAQIGEMPFFEYRIDLFGYSHELRSTIAVELKLVRWKRAIEQALIYQLCSDLAFVALPTTQIGRVDQSQFTQHGIGLIEVLPSGDCTCVVEARTSKVVRSHYRQHYVDILLGTD